MADKNNIKELITAYVDNELKGSELENFEAVLNEDTNLKQLVEQEQSIKSLIQSNVKKVAVPDSLRMKIDNVLSQEQAKMESLTNKNGGETTNRINSAESSTKKSFSRVFLLAAATIIFAILLWTTQSDQSSSTVASEGIPVEYMTFVHFQNHEGSGLPPSFDAHNTMEAQSILKEQYGCNITVPELAGAEFAGVVYADFHDGFHTPLLSYRVSDGDYIYIFAFEMKNLDGNADLSRHPQAADAIIAHNDVYIIDYEGLHVVSWKWNDVWYSGISKHHGDVLAAMLPH